MKLRSRWLGCALIAAGLWSVSVSGAMGQQPGFAQRKVPQGFSSTTADAAAKEAGPLADASKKAIRDMVDYYMSNMTDPKKVEVSRNYLMQKLQINSKDGAQLAAQTVVEIATDILNPRNNYHPAVKINAMLILAELNEQNRPSSQASGRLYQFAIAKGVKLPCHLRCLALMGLERHVRAMPYSAGRAEMFANDMMAIIASKPEQIQEEKAHWWMVRRAYDVLDGIHAGISSAPEQERKLAPALLKAKEQALELFANSTTLPSVRISAGKYLTHFNWAIKDDTTNADEIERMKLFLAVSLLLDGQVVGWYEDEDDKTRMASGGGMMGMGGMGGMMGGGMMDGGMSGDMGGYGGAMGGDGYGGMMGGEGGGLRDGGPKPIDTQSWDLRIARRKLNTYCQLSHVLLRGIPADGERRYDPLGKGVLEAELPKSAQRPAKLMLEALVEVQKAVNERSLTTVSTLMTRTRTPLTKLREACELVEAYRESEDGPVLVPAFKDVSPRMLSFKKADARSELDAPASAPVPPAEGEPGQPAAGQPGDAQPAGAVGAGAVGAGPAGAGAVGAGPAGAGAAPAAQ